MDRVGRVDLPCCWFRGNPYIGKLGDSYGKKKFLLVALIFYTIGVTGNGFAWSLPSLLVFRAIQGVGLGTFPLAFAIIRDEFPPERVPAATGIISAMFGAGAAIGLVVGAWVANNYGWQTTYHTVIPVAIALTILAALTLKESPILTPSRVDVFGATTFAVAVISFLIAMTEGTTWGWASAGIIGLLVLAIAFILVFVVVEMHIRDPLIDLTMLRKRNVFLPNIASFIAGLMIFLLFQTIVYLMELPPPTGFGTDIFQAGVVLAPGAAFMLSRSTDRRCDRRKARRKAAALRRCGNSRRKLLLLLRVACNAAANRARGYFCVYRRRFYAHCND